MSQSIENYILDHRAAFDAAEPDIGLWKGIERGLQTTDALEKFLLSERTYIDEAVPDQEVWMNIEKGLDSNDPLEKFILENRVDFDMAPLPANAQPPLFLNGKNGSEELEAFLSENREKLDAATPNPAIWNRVEQSISQGEKPAAKVVQMTWGRQLLRIAAAITLLLSCFGAGMWYAGKGQQQAEAMSMSEISPENAEVEVFYQKEIEIKQQKLAAFASLQQQPVLEDLSQMDRAMEELRRELKNVPEANREQVVHAMIENYKAKAAILEKVLEHIEHQEQSKVSNQHGIKNI